MSMVKHTSGKVAMTTTTATTTSATSTPVVEMVVARYDRNDRIRYYPQVHELLFKHKKALGTHNVFVYNTPLMYCLLSSYNDKHSKTDNDRESYFFSTALDTGKRLVHVAYLDYQQSTSDIFSNRCRRRGSAKEHTKHYYNDNYYDTSSDEDDEDGNEVSDESDRNDKISDVGDKRQNNVESRSAHFDNYINRNRIQTFTCNAMKLHRRAIVVLFLNNISFTDAINAFGSVSALNYCVLLASNNLGVDALSLIVSDMLRNMLQHGGKLWNIFSKRPYTCTSNKFIVLNPYAYVEKIHDM